jgi:hypothetical protein
VFSVRFLKNTIKTEPGAVTGEGAVTGDGALTAMGAPSSQDHMYENMQVSAIVMLNQETGDSSKRLVDHVFIFIFLFSAG